MDLEEDDPEVLLDAFPKVVSFIVDNDVESLKNLLEKLPNNLNFVDDNDNNLLHISILLDKYDIFKYLLSLDYFDLEATNVEETTVLSLLLLSHSRHLNEQYALDLIEKGASIHTLCYDRNTYLHLALMEHHLLIARALIEKGANINAQNEDGCTPLHTVFHRKIDSNAVNEGVCLMLYYGADSSIPDNNGNLPFELAVIYDFSIVTAQENLFFSTFDIYSKYVMSCEVFFELLESQSSLFLQIADYISDVVFIKGAFFSPSVFFKIEPQVLKVVIEKFDYVISDIFLELCPIFWNDIEFLSLPNWEILLESKLAPDTIHFIRKIKLESLIAKFTDDEIPPKAICDFIFYLLSYGLNVCEKDLDSVYKYYRYCDLFKLLLHMDIQYSMCDIVPRIVYDIHLDLDAFLDDPHNYSLNAFEELLSYFNRPKLKEVCYKLDVKRIIEKAENLPRVPLLVELARDATRQHLMKKFALNTCRDFYWYLNKLDVSYIHRRILSFETKLYVDNC